MAGGTWQNNVDKVRPGTYVRTESSQQNKLKVSERGICLIPLIDHQYGPEKEFITISTESPDAAIDQLGFSVYDDNDGMLLIREAAKRAKTIIVYIPKQGKKAKGTSGPLTGTAKWGGSRGNILRFTVLANTDGETFDVQVYLDTELMAEYEKLRTVEELIEKENAWIDFSGSGDLAEVAGCTLTGGTGGETTNADLVQFLDDAESVKWNTMAFPVAATGEKDDTAPALYAAVASKIEYLRDGAGKYRKAVLPGYSADFEGVINVTNSVELSDGTELSTAQVTAWVAGADAGASEIESLTNVAYEDAVRVIGAKGDEEAKLAIKNGEFFFTRSEDDEIVVEYDINSLVNPSDTQDETYRKNRVLRVLDTFSETVMREFPPNRFSNNDTDWNAMEGLGQALLTVFEDRGAIKNVEPKEDFVVDRTASVSDRTYIDIGLQPVDSSEKIYIRVRTR